jgi:hypothetical protein
MSEPAASDVRLRCACGWEATGPLESVVAATEEHGRRLHNMTPTRAEILAMLVPPADAPNAPTIVEPAS